jgi:predicted DNA-binding protein
VYLYILKRTQICVDEEQDVSLAERAAAAGVTKSTLIREAIDAYLKGSSNERLRLERFRAAVRAATGSSADLPDGESYVEALRSLGVRRQEEIERRRRA